MEKTINRFTDSQLLAIEEEIADVMLKGVTQAWAVVIIAEELGMKAQDLMDELA